MGHPLPDDVFSVNGMRYFLVALPDDSAFLYAALAIYSKLENAYMWGLEGEVEQDSEKAAQLWATAVAETVRLIQMGWPDVVIEHIDEIEDMLSALQRLTGCCPDADISDGDFYTDDVTDGNGAVPQNIIDAGYASTQEDWASFETYKCMVAHVVVDDLEGKLRKLAPLVDDAGLVIGGIGAIIAIITAIVTAGATALVIGILGSAGAAAALWSTISSGSLLESLADKVATNHDDLACGFMAGDGPTDSINGLFAEIDNLFNTGEAAILKLLNTKPVAKALYAGRYDQQNVAQTLADNGYVATSYNCDCAYEWQYDYTFDASSEGWNQVWVGADAVPYDAIGARIDSSDKAAAKLHASILTDLGQPPGTVLLLENFSALVKTREVSAGGATFTLEVYDDVSELWEELATLNVPDSTSAWTPISWTGQAEIIGGNGVRIWGKKNGASGGQQFVYWDDITIAGSYT